MNKIVNNVIIGIALILLCIVNFLDYVVLKFSNITKLTKLFNGDSMAIGFLIAVLLFAIIILIGVTR